MKLKKLFALGLALLMSASLAACAGETGGEGMRSLDLSEKNFKPLGRAYFDGGRIYCALSGTGAEFTFTGTRCTVTVAGDSTATNSSQADNQSRLAIYLNGERVVDEMIDSETETFEVLDSSSEQTVDVKIVKLSESPMSTLSITDISIDGHGEAPAAENEHFIEFVGDSITCGYGVDDEDRNHHFSTKTEDVTKAYAYKTAELLGSDYSMVSYSGYGIISGYSDGSRKVSEQALPQYYEKLGYSWSSNGDFKPSEIDWRFERQPDVVVINLGTNDASYCQNKEDRREEYRNEYVNFLKTVRKDNPGATVICALGIMGKDLCGDVIKVVNAYKDETGDENVYYFEFDNQSEADGIAADWHPTEATHSKAADKLAGKIKEVMGW